MLVAKDGMIIYNKSFGYFDYESRQPVTEASVYDLASASKAAGTDGVAESEEQTDMAGDTLDDSETPAA